MVTPPTGSVAISPQPPTPESLSMTRGDNVQLTVTISNLTSTGLTGATLRFTAKHDPDDPDSAAVMNKSTAAGAGITVATAGNAATPGVAVVQLTPSDTNGLGDYDVLLAWDVQMTDTNGNDTTVARGALTVEADVTETS